MSVFATSDVMCGSFPFCGYMGLDLNPMTLGDALEYKYKKL